MTRRPDRAQSLSSGFSTLAIGTTAPWQSAFRPVGQANRDPLRACEVISGGPHSRRDQLWTLSPRRCFNRVKIRRIHERETATAKSHLPISFLIHRPCGSTAWRSTRFFPQKCHHVIISYHLLGNAVVGCVQCRINDGRTTILPRRLFCYTREGVRSISSSLASLTLIKSPHHLFLFIVFFPFSILNRVFNTNLTSPLQSLKPGPLVGSSMTGTG